MWCDFVLSERLFPSVESVQPTELLSELLVHMLIVPMEAVSVFEHMHLFVAQAILACFAAKSGYLLMIGRATGLKNGV